jgi:hypothetical protein
VRIEDPRTLREGAAVIGRVGALLPLAPLPGPVGTPRRILPLVVTGSLYGRSGVWCAHQELRCRAATGVVGRLGLVINLVIRFMALVLVLYEATQPYEREGERSPARGWTGLWNLIPLTGTIIWCAGVQGARNRSWSRQVRRARRRYLPRRRKRGLRLSPARLTPTAPKNAATPPPIMAIVSTMYKNTIPLAEW